MAVTAAFLVIAALWFMRAYYLARSRLARMEMRLENLDTAEQELRALRQKNSDFLEDKTRAETRLAEVLQHLEEVKGECQHLQSLRDAEAQARNDAEKRVSLMQQKLEEESARRSDWESQREEFLTLSRSAIMKTGSELSSKLLEDHKRETEAAKKSSEELTKKTTEELFREFRQISQSVATLKTQSGETRDKMSKVWQALTAPASGGQLAEIGLENSLKNLGLEPKRDFIMQYAITAGDGTGLRPDAVIRLPNNMLMVIDSKASKFSVEAADEEDEAAHRHALAKLAKSMNEHLKALQSKDYLKAIQSMYRESGGREEIGHVLTVMYLPSEGAIERIKHADPEFIHKIEKAKLILAGPASLSGLLSIAGNNIAAAQQAENYSLILDRVQAAMESMITMFEYAAGFGKNLRTTANYYDRFANSVNKRVLPRLRAITQLGVKPGGNKELPGSLISYDIRLSDEVITLEAEQEEEKNDEESSQISHHKGKIKQTA